MPPSHLVHVPFDANSPLSHDMQLFWSSLGAAPVPQVAHSSRPKVSLNLPLGQRAQALDDDDD